VWNYINPDQDNLETYPAAPEPPVCPTLEQEDGNPVENIADPKDLYVAKVAEYNIRLQIFKEKKKELDYIDDLIDRTQRDGSRRVRRLRRMSERCCKF